MQISTQHVNAALRLNRALDLLLVRHPLQVALVRRVVVVAREHDDRPVPEYVMVTAEKRVENDRSNLSDAQEYCQRSIHGDQRACVQSSDGRTNLVAGNCLNFIDHDRGAQFACYRQHGHRGSRIEII
jgi:hypothetical protein